MQDFILQGDSSRLTRLIENLSGSIQYKYEYETSSKRLDDQEK